MIAADVCPERPHKVHGPVPVGGGGERGTGPRRFGGGRGVDLAVCNCQVRGRRPAVSRGGGLRLSDRRPSPTATRCRVRRPGAPARRAVRAVRRSLRPATARDGPARVSAAGPARRPPGAHGRPAIPSTGPYCGASGWNRWGSRHARPARVPAAWSAMPRRGGAAPSGLPTAERKRLRGARDRRACPAAPIRHCGEPAQGSGPLESLTFPRVSLLR